MSDSNWGAIWLFNIKIKTMKYLVKDYGADQKILVTGDSKTEIVLKTLKNFLDDSWAEDLMDNLSSSFELEFTNLDNLSTI